MTTAIQIEATPALVVPGGVAGSCLPYQFQSYSVIALPALRSAVGGSLCFFSDPAVRPTLACWNRSGVERRGCYRCNGDLMPVPFSRLEGWRGAVPVTTGGVRAVAQ